MDRAWLARMRWRRSGAWLWPAFALGTIFDAAIGHALPPAGESQALMGAALLGCFLNLFAAAVLCWAVAALIRRVRPDLPWVVARDYGGTIAIVAISVVLLAAGLQHRPSLQAHKLAMHEAVARAQAWIGDRAPAEFRRHMERVSTFAIEPGSIYRTCATSDLRPRTFCVIVKVHLPLARSVSFDGYESNEMFSAGAG
jgi:hypothetical protein